MRPPASPNYNTNKISLQREPSITSLSTDLETDMPSCNLTQQNNKHISLPFSSNTRPNQQKLQNLQHSFYIKQFKSNNKQTNILENYLTAGQQIAVVPN